MTYTELKNTIYSILAQLNPSATIIRADGQGTRPSLPYLTYKIENFESIGMPYFDGETDVSGNENIKYDENFQVTLRGYGLSARDLMKVIKDKLRLNSGIDILVANNIALRELNNPITDISLTIDNTTEKQYLWEIIMGYAEQITDDPDYIANVELIDNINQPN